MNAPLGERLSQEQRDMFEHDGFVALRGVLKRPHLEQLREAMDLALKTFAESPNSYDVTHAADQFWTETPPSDQGSVQYDLGGLAKAVRASGLRRLMDHGAPELSRGRFLVDTGVWRRAPALAELALKGLLPRVASELISTHPLRFYDDQLFVKEGGALDRAAFHQDISYFHLEGTRGCVLWIPLEPARRGGGAIGYVPGSHKWGKVFNPNIFMSQMPFPGCAGESLPDIEGHEAEYGVRYLEADPGDVLVHHFLTVHGSEGNTGSSPRSAFSLRYIDADLRYKHRPGAPLQPLHLQTSKDGDKLDDSIHPLVG